MRIAAREIGAGRAVIGHEQGIADEGRVGDFVSDIRRRVTRREDHLRILFADLELFAVLEQMIEIAAVYLEIGGVENRPEDSLHIPDVLADADLRARLGLDVRRTGQMVGVHMGLQRPDDRITLLIGHAEQRVDRTGVNLAGARLIVEHRIDHRRLLGIRVGDDIADGIRRLVKERANNGLVEHDALLHGLTGTIY